MDTSLHTDSVAVHAGREDLTALGVHALPIDLSTTNPLPELQRVIVTSSNPGQGVVMSDRLDTALVALANGRHGVVMSTTAAPGTSTTTPGTTGDLAAQALDHFTKARAAAERGDWATYGSELDALERVLKLLNER